MKTKLSAVALAVITLFTFAACGSGGSGAPSGSDTQSSSAAPAPVMSFSTQGSTDAHSDAQPTVAGAQADYVGAAFTVEAGDDGTNEYITGAEIVFSGDHPTIAWQRDITDIVLTKDGSPLSIAIPMGRKIGGDGQTIYRLEFDPAPSIDVEGIGTYSFGCTILGVAVSTGDYYFDENSQPGFNTASSNGGGSGNGTTPGMVMPDGGLFEGDMNGYGVWSFANYTYEGDFLNGVPNGAGTLSLVSSVDGKLVITITGTWIDGYADGEITYVQGNNAPAIFPVSRGVPTVTQPTNTGSVGIALSEDDLIGVPPWVNMQSSGSLILM